MRMRILKLDHNYIPIIPSDIQHLKNLKKLSISFNCIRKIPKEIQELKNTLHHLNIGNNRIEALPKELFNLRKLRGLHIYNNHFTRFPVELSNLKQLNEFSLAWFKYCNPRLTSHIYTNDDLKILHQLFSLCNILKQEGKHFVSFKNLISFKFKQSKKRMTLRRIIQNTKSQEEKTQALILQSINQGSAGCLKALIRMNYHLMNKEIEVELKRDKKLLTPLALAIKEKKYVCAHILLKLGADPNAQGISEDGAALHVSIETRSWAMIKKLLKFGANPNIRDNQQNTPLHYLFITFGGQLEKSKIIANLLMKAGADPNQKNKNLWAPIHMACYFNQLEAIKWLLEYNKQLPDKIKQKQQSEPESFKLNEKGGNRSYTPLQLAVIQGFNDIISLLLQQSNIDLFLENSIGKTAAQMAAIKGIYCILMKKQKQWIMNNLYQQAMKPSDKKINNFVSMKIQVNSDRFIDRNIGFKLRTQQSRYISRVQLQEQKSQIKNELKNILKKKRQMKQVFYFQNKRRTPFYQKINGQGTIEQSVDYMCGVDENDKERFVQKQQFQNQYMIKENYNTRMKQIPQQQALDVSQQSQLMNYQLNEFSRTQIFQTYEDGEIFDQIQNSEYSHFQNNQDMPFSHYNDLINLDEKTFLKQLLIAQKYICNVNAQNKTLSQRINCLVLLNLIFFKIVNRVKTFRPLLSGHGCDNNDGQMRLITYNHHHHHQQAGVTGIQGNLPLYVSQLTEYNSS